MIRQTFARLFSWWHNKKIGEVRYVNPYIIGNLNHFLPSDLWTEKEKSTLRYRVEKQTWDGFGWERGEILVLTREQLIDKLKSRFIIMVKEK